MERVLHDEIALDGAAISKQASASRILFADDSSCIRWVIQRYLEGLGYSVHVVDDGRQAVEAAKQHAFDVVILDLLMPALDGVEAAREIRAHASATEQRPIIFCATSQRVKNLGDQWDETLFDEVLSKPFDGEDLARLITVHARQVEA